MALGKDRKRGLGRGLTALMADVAEAENVVSSGREAERYVPIDQVEPNPEQPRKRFGQDDLDDLAASIKEKGVIQPLIVRVIRHGRYQIVAGERRWRAAKMVNQKELPVVIRDFTDSEVLEVAIVENIQRSDLNPMEEAIGYRQLMDRFGHTQEKLAEALGKSRSHIANVLRLLKLPEDVVELVKQGKLSSGHARTLVTAENASDLALQIVENDLTVRAAEALAKAASSKTATKSTQTKTKEANSKDADIKALSDDLSANLGMKVTLKHKTSSEQGVMSIQYGSLEELDELCRRLAGA